MLASAWLTTSTLDKAKAKPRLLRATDEFCADALQIGASMLMGELGLANAQDMMDPRTLLSALDATQTIALAWIWKCAGDADPRC